MVSQFEYMKHETVMNINVLGSKSTRYLARLRDPTYYVIITITIIIIVIIIIIIIIITIIIIDIIFFQC